MTQYRIDTNEFLNTNKTIYEVVMVADKEGNVTGSGNFTGSAVDAFGRARFSTPYTLFDSQNRFQDTEKFDTSTTGTANTSYLVNESTISLNVNTSENDEVIRQSKRVFPYQPGKSLLVLNTFVMNEPKTNLRQRIGYFDTQNGIFIEQDGTNIYLVKRSYSSGSVVETRIAQSDWNGDTLNGTSATSTTGFVLDLTKSQIFWMDIEWLGVGSVRCGFVINGQMVVAHTFHNANQFDSVYMTTANLSIRYEIKNSGGNTDSVSSLKQICSTVISEGGYEARAKTHVLASSNIDNSAISIGTVFTNVASIKLKSGRENAVVVPAGLDVLNISNVDFEWALLLNATPTSGLTFNQNVSDNVVGSLTTDTFSDIGQRIAGGYLGGKTAPFTIGDGFSFENQLGRTIDGTSDVLTLAVRAASSSSKCAGMLKWYEII